MLPVYCTLANTHEYQRAKCGFFVAVPLGERLGSVHTKLGSALVVSRRSRPHEFRDLSRHSTTTQALLVSVGSPHILVREACTILAFFSYPLQNQEEAVWSLG